MTLHGVSLVNDGLRSDQDALWVGVQTLLTGAANTSKALWGAGGRFATERRALRESLAVDDSSPFRDVSMRNHFEHYDERLDRWWRESESRNYLDHMIGPPDAVSGLSDGDRFRVYDPTTHEVVFWGEKFNVQAIATATAELLPRATAEAAKPHWTATSGEAWMGRDD